MNLQSAGRAGGHTDLLSNTSAAYWSARAHVLIRQRSGQVCSSSAPERPEPRSRGGVSGDSKRKKKKPNGSKKARPRSGLPYDVNTQSAVDLRKWNEPKVDALAWTSMIMASDNPDELQRCLAGLHSLNKFHLTAAISKLASFGRGAHRTAGMRLVPALALRAKEAMTHLQPRSLVAVAHCLGTYEFKDKDLMTMVAKAAESSFPDFTTQGLANLLWGFARLSMQPSQRWMDAYLAACQAKLPRFKAQELSMLLWALAKLKFRVAPTMLKDLLQRVVVDLPICSPQSISNVLWCLGVFEHRPDDEWLAAVAAEMTDAVKLPTFTHQGLSQGLWALAILKYEPKDDFKLVITEEIRFRLYSCNSTDLATFMYACAGMRMRIDEHMAERLQECTVRNMESMQPSHLAKSIWTFAKLDITPSPAWLFKLLTMAYQVMDTFNVRDLSMLAWGMAKLGLTPPRAFLMPMVHRIELLAPEFPPQEVANTMWALACFHVRPSSVLLAQFFEATDKRLSTFRPLELSLMIWALADRYCILDPLWVQEFLKVSFMRMPDFSPRSLGSIVWAMSRLRLSPPPAWLYSFTKVCAERLAARTFKAQDLGMLVNALSRMNEERQLQKVSDFVLDAMDALSCMEMESQAYTRHQLKRMLAMSAPAHRPSSTATAAAAAGSAGVEAAQQSSQEGSRGSSQGNSTQSSQGSSQEGSQGSSQQSQEGSRESSQHGSMHSSQQGEPQRQDEVHEAGADASSSAPPVEMDVDVLREYFAKMSKVHSRVEALQAHQESKDKEAKLKTKAASSLQRGSSSSSRRSSTAAQLWKGIKGARQQLQQQQQQQPQQQQQQQQQHFGTLTIQVPTEMQIEMPDLYAELSSHGSSMSIHTGSHGNGSSGSSGSSGGMNGGSSSTTSSGPSPSSSCISSCGSEGGAHDDGGSAAVAGEGALSSKDLVGSAG